MRPQISSDEAHRIAFGFSPSDDRYVATRLRNGAGERAQAQFWLGAQIDPKLVKITYLKQSPIDLTGRIAAFILSNGIDIPRALVAPGKHLIQIDVVDTEGRETSRILTLDVTR